jgi:hypothetical protein
VAFGAWFLQPIHKNRYKEKGGLSGWIIMRFWTGSAVFVLLAAVLAGCIDASVDDEDDVASKVAADWWVGSIPSSAIDDDHDHSDHSHHSGITTANFEVLGWDPLVTEQHNGTVPGMMCGGVAEQGERKLALVHSISHDMAFMVADVTDPHNPFLVGEFYMPNAVNWDADITPDGRHAVVGAYPVGVFGSQEPQLPDVPLNLQLPETAPSDPVMEALGLWKPQMFFRNACTGEFMDVGPEHYLPFGPGIVLISLEPPEEPTFEDWRSQPVVGPHSVGAHMIDGEVIVTSSVTNLAHEGSYYHFFRVMDGPTGSVLEPYSQIRAPGIVTPVESDPSGPSPWLNGHLDVWLHEHPVTGQVIAYLANWDAMYVYDMSDPLVPMELAMWDGADDRSIHTTYPFPYLVDGKQYLVVGQEVSERSDRPTGWMFILDVTDPENPEELGRWTLPEKPRWDHGGLQFSTHYARVYNDTMFAAVNHAGLWAVDVSDPTDPRAIGVFLPDQPSPSPVVDIGPHTGDVHVDLETGVVTTWDLGAGVYQLRFHFDVEAPPAPAWSPEMLEG